MTFSSTEHKLKERIKELVCLYETTNTLNQRELSIEDLLRRLSVIIKNGMRFVEECTVEILYKEHHVYTQKINFKTILIKENITYNESSYGYIKVHYPSEKFTGNDFLNEEIKLLFKINAEMCNFLENKENREKEEQLKRSIERNDRLSILGEITAGIAHELNTPLGNILGFAELIKGENNKKTIDNDISKIINAAIYSREIVKKLMFFSCEMPQNKEIVPIKPIIKQAVLLLGPNFKKASIACQINFKNSNIKAQIDEIQLTQVMFNILINAIYVSPIDSTIIIDVYSEENNFIIEIKDFGTGVKKEIKDKIFEPFFTTKPIGEGSGLGLSVVHGIIKSHHGEISVKKNKPKGTIFKISLPLKTTK